jgi:hypothetical protein
MTTYRTGNHWGVTIVAETELGPAAVDAQLVAVIVNGDQALAEQICELLNADQPDTETSPTRPTRTPGQPETVPGVPRGTPAHPKPAKPPSATPPNGR